MGSSFFQMAFLVLGGCGLGVFIGWSIQALKFQRQFELQTRDAQDRLHTVAAERDGFSNGHSRAEAKIERLKAANAKRTAEFKNLLKKTKVLANNVRTLKQEREDTKAKLSTIQTALSTLRQQTSALQREFNKSREFYKRELLKSLQKRKELEEEIKLARAEQESFAKAVESSTLEHGSKDEMIVAAQLRLGQLKVLERNVNKLEAENAELRKEAQRVKQDFAAREQDLTELEELRLHNRQLVQCVEALEQSRKEQEDEAERFREQADESEKLSDTLRLKLDDLEQNFADIEKEQQRAIQDARDASVVPILRKQG